LEPHLRLLKMKSTTPVARFEKSSRLERTESIWSKEKSSKDRVQLIVQSSSQTTAAARGIKGWKEDQERHTINVGKVELRDRRQKPMCVEPFCARPGLHRASFATQSVVAFIDAVGLADVGGKVARDFGSFGVVEA
jgi:hypothetical protein